MIRWRFLLSRVLIVGLVIIAIRYGLGPVAKYVTARAIESATGAKVDIDDVVVGLFPPSLRYEKIAIADPRKGKSMNDAVRIEQMAVEIDGGSLLHRRYVVRDGRVTGLKFDSDRISSGHFEPSIESENTSGGSSAATQWIMSFLSSIGDGAVGKAAAMGNDLEMVKRSDQIRRRWKSEYAVLAQRATSLETTIEQVRGSAKGIENPLRDWPRIEAALAKSRELQSELAAVREAIDELPTKVQADLIAMQDAKQIDLDRVSRMTSVDLEDTDSLAPRLLADLVNGQVDKLRDFVNTGREVANWTVASPTSQRGRGETIDLLTGKRHPEFLIRRCEIEGVLTGGGRDYVLSGILENVTSEPLLRPQPFHARVKLDGPQLVRLDYSRDDSSTVPRETLTVHWPEIAAPRVQIGNEQSLELDMREGRMELWAQVDMSGDQIQGRIVSRRIETKIDLRCEQPLMRGTTLVSSLAQSLRSVDRVEIDAAFHGSWTAMDVAISTNLTQLLKGGVERAIDAQLTATKLQVSAKINESYQAQVAELQTFIAGEQNQARSLVAKADQKLQDLSDRILKETGSADVYLGRLRGSLMK